MKVNNSKTVNLEILNLFRYTKIKMSVYRSLLVPILTIKNEIWALTKAHKSKIQTAEMEKNQINKKHQSK